MDNTSFLAQFRLLLPEFAATADAVILLFKGQAERRMSQKIWGRLYQDGLCYLTAHLVISNRGLNNIPVTRPVKDVVSESVSDVSYSVATGKATGSSFNTTIYGQHYFELREIIGKAVIRVW